MTSARLLVLLFTLTLIVACGGGGGDINVNANDNSVNTDNSVSQGGGDNNPCAFYTDATNTTFRGSFDGTNCNYNSAFVGETNPLRVNMTIPFITGVHIFADTLQVGENIDGSDPSIVPPAGGQGPILTISAGATLAWTDASDYLLINRGSQLIAQGSPTAPITLTGFADAVTGSAGPEDVQLWGGVVINGNGRTNKCSDAQAANNGCHVLSEGKPSNYGGNDNADNSGVLKYLVVKHAGFEVAPGDELNGISFNTVGSGTLVSHIEIYSSYDDGVELFGGAVEIDHLVALYVKDDSIDYSDGWVGSVSHALVIHSRTDGNRCIEADNQGSDFTATPTTSPVISNMTCIMSANDGGTHGDSEGILLRRGVQSQIVDSILYDGYGRKILLNSGNECFELNDPETAAFAFNGDSSVKSTLVACQEATKGDLTPSSTDTTEQWLLNAGTSPYAFNTGNIVLKTTDQPNVTVLGGAKAFYTAAQFTDDLGNPISITSEGGGIIGAVDGSDDWTTGWTFGLDNLWF